MNETLQHVTSMLEDRPAVDNTPVHIELWELLGELKKRTDERFELTRDPSSEPYAAYGPSGGDPTSGLPGGAMRTFSGPEIDWQVSAWVGNPALSFSNMHLTTWLGPQVRVPHLAYAFGTLPDLYFLVDYTPRTDLMVDVDSLDRYYAEVNDSWLEVKAHQDLKYFTSRSLDVRQNLSETAFCYTAPTTPDNVALVRRLAHEAMDRWLRWLDEAPPTTPEERLSLAARDVAIRRNVAQRDPANAVAVKYFGQQFTDGLVRQLWGGDRTLPHPS